MKRTMVIVGLGLIGGSLALALKGFEDFEIVGVDVSQPTLRYAAEHGVGDRVTEKAADVVPKADVVALALHPQGIVDFLAQYREQFKPGPWCGTCAASRPPFWRRRPCCRTRWTSSAATHGGHRILRRGARLCRDVPGLPLPDGAPERSKPEHIALLSGWREYIGCKDVCRTTAEAHDALIAYTSQVMHIIAVAVCDDPELFDCRGFEGSSFRGCTRVAALDVGLWTQLFSLNRPALLSVLDRLLGNLQAYRDTLASGDRDALADKLAHSAARKRQMDLPGPDLLE